MGTMGPASPGSRADPAARRSRARPAERPRGAARPLRVLRAGPVRALPRRTLPARLPAAAAGRAAGEHREPGEQRGEQRAGCPRSRRAVPAHAALSPQVPPARCALFDPAFSAREAAALRALGLCLLTENEVRRAPGQSARDPRGTADTARP